jgi:hypothetical protein
MQSYWLLKQMVHIVTTGLWKDDLSCFENLNQEISEWEPDTPSLRSLWLEFASNYTKIFLINLAIIP